jgi:hypothetical protein
MEEDVVFRRTAAGEAAVRQPTRLLQRNLRSALQLVDGGRDKKEILRHFADRTIGSAALADLLRAGLIEIPQQSQEATLRARPFRPRAAAAPASVTLPEQIVESEPGAAGAIIETITVEDLDDVRAAFSDFGHEFRRAAKRASEGPQRLSGRAGTGASKTSDTRRGQSHPAATDTPVTGREDRPGKRLLKLLAGLLGLLILGQGIAAFLPQDRFFL